MAPHAPQSAAGGSASLPTYHSAYGGYATDRKGKFTHFIRQPDKSHLENGYWRFTSSQDEHRAFERGYHTPEDILVAADSGEHDDDINMLWVPGAIDPNLKSQISGCAMAHLRNIYDIRIILRKALSFRGRVPTYPVSPHLKEYWEVRLTTWSLPSQQYAVQVSTVQTPSPLQGVGGLSSIVASGAGPQEGLSHELRKQASRGNYSSEPVIITAASSVVRSPAQFPGMTAGTPPPPSSPAKPIFVSQLSQNTTAPPQPIAYQAPPTGPTIRASDRPVHVAAQPHNTSGRVPPVQNTPLRHPGHAQNARQLHASQESRRTLSQHAPSQQPRPNLAVQPVQQGPKPPHVPGPARASNLKHFDTFASVQNVSPYQPSPYTPPPFGPHGGYFPPSVPPPGNAQSFPASSTRPGSHKQYPEMVSGIHAQSQVPAMSHAGPRVQQPQKQALSIDPHLAQRNQVPNTTFSPPITPLSFASDDLGLAVFGEEVPETLTEAKPPSKTEYDPSTLVIPEPANPGQIQSEDLRAQSPKWPLEADRDEIQRPKKRKGDNHQDEDIGISGTVEESPPPAALDIYADLPCMDCGEIEGHQWGCHLGTHSPKK